MAATFKFSNGHVKNAEKLDFRLFKHSDGVNPRKKTRRIVVAESDRLPYVGSNFGSGSLQCNNLCRYFVGVLDKKTMQMEVHNAQMFNMLPLIPDGMSLKEEFIVESVFVSSGETAVNEDTKQAETYREKVDALIEAFGTNKQKRALSSRRLNEVGNENLQQAVAMAASNVINQKGVEVLSPNEFDALKDVGAKMAALTPEDLQKMKAENSPQTVLRHLELLPKDDAARDRQSRCVWYLSFLIKASQQKRLSFKFGVEDGCPRIIINKVVKNFTVESFHQGRQWPYINASFVCLNSLRNTVSTSMRMKLAAHCLALLLHMGDLKANLTLLHRDMGISDVRMMELAKAMGLTLSRQLAQSKEQSGTQEEHRMASLVLPLVKYDRRMERRKRKRMN
ncbi:DNA-directed RNA polymerase I subunit RPA49 [Labeo rohita]|uniref:DNA-directed RNA polymerase I subunit RPA49 n=1 Tax=Labeo rohita TaxID=84645 RepID=A0A498N9Y5_LABRO|nr:DNA-directed RNA polymerase I subunit RPA49 [Labeo rohita]